MSSEDHRVLTALSSPGDKRDDNVNSFANGSRDEKITSSSSHVRNGTILTQQLGAASQNSLSFPEGPVSSMVVHSSGDNLIEGAHRVSKLILDRPSSHPLWDVISVNSVTADEYDTDARILTIPQ